MYYTEYFFPIGTIVLTSDGKYLTGLWFKNQKHFPAKVYENIKCDDLVIFKQTITWLKQYFSKLNPPINILLKPKGTSFQEKVWQLLQQIPYGKVLSYKELTKQYLDTYHLNKMSSLAIARAVSYNPISIIIPCHRVIGQNGQLVGYAGGIERKQFLLELEKTLKS